MCLRKSGVFEDVGSCCKSKASVSRLPKCIVLREEMEAHWEPLHTCSCQHSLYLQDLVSRPLQSPRGHSPVCSAAEHGLQTAGGLFKGFPPWDHLHSIISHQHQKGSNPWDHSSPKTDELDVLPSLSRVLRSDCSLPLGKFRYFQGTPRIEAKEVRCINFSKGQKYLSLPPSAHTF